MAKKGQPQKVFKTKKLLTTFFARKDDFCVLLTGSNEFSRFMLVNFKRKI